MLEPMVYLVIRTPHHAAAAEHDHDHESLADQNLIAAWFVVRVVGFVVHPLADQILIARRVLVGRVA